MIYKWEARQCGRPTTRICAHMEAGACRRPFGVYMGSPTKREARRKNTDEDPRRSAHAGGQMVYKWEARQRGRPTTRIDVHVEVGRPPETLV